MNKKDLCIKCKEDIQYTSKLCRKCYLNEFRRGIDNRNEEDNL